MTPFFIQFAPRFAWYFFIIRASDTVLSIFEILGISWGRSGHKVVNCALLADLYSKPVIFR